VNCLNNSFAEIKGFVLSLFSEGLNTSVPYWKGTGQTGTVFNTREKLYSSGLKYIICLVRPEAASETLFCPSL